MPQYRSMKLGLLEKQLISHQFQSLNEELKFILNWLKKINILNVFAVNLTRQGVEIPIVKIIAPKLKAPREALFPFEISSNEILLRKYRL